MQFSPDGTRIAFASLVSGHSEVWVSNRDGFQARQLTNFAGGGRVGSPSWSADGKRIAFDAIRTGTGHFNLHIVSADAGMRLEQAFRLTHDLLDHFEDGSIGLDLPDLPSNTISGQLWCVVGARESYLRAIAAGEWSGFSCSLAAPMSRTSILAALHATVTSSSNSTSTAEITATQQEFGFALLEHEVQHHGQLIRFVYGNHLTFPASWHDRYTV